MSKTKIKFKKLDDAAVLPFYAHEGDLGLDVTAISCEYDDENDQYIYHTGLAIESDKHIGDLVFTRSSNGRTDAYLVNHVGLVDSASYRGEIQLRFKNRTSLEMEVFKRVLPRVFVAYSFKDHLMWMLTGNGKEYLPMLYMDTLQIVAAEVEKDAKELKFAPYKVGERVGQFVITEFPEVEIEVVDELSETTRGVTGFGESGK